MSSPSLQETKVPKWYLAYFFLAAFDILTVSLSMFLTHNITDIFFDSVKVNKVWATRQNNLSELRLLASGVNAPGNEVFNSHNVPAENIQLDTAIKQYIDKKQQIQDDLNHNVNPDVAKKLSLDLVNIQLALDKMIDDTHIIFALFRNQELQRAGEHMAIMDRKFVQVNQAFVIYEAHLRNIQEQLLSSQRVETEKMQQYEIIVGIAILLMVAGATFYGHNIYQNMKQAAIEKDKLLKKLLQSETQTLSILDTATDAIISINDTGIISRFNGAAESLLGYHSSEIIGQNISTLMGGTHNLNHNTYLSNYLTTGIKKIIGQSREVFTRHKKGHLISIHLSISDTGIKGDNRFTGIMRDLSEINAANEKLQQHETHLESVVQERTKELERANNKLKQLSEIDPLTQIANRRVYRNRLTKEIASAKRTKQPLALLMIDIDYFKDYNDYYGHNAGDQTLKDVAKAIEQMAPRKTDMVARFGGEEFVVLLPSTDNQGAYIIAESIRKHIQALELPHQSSKAAPSITVSIGSSSLQDEDLDDFNLLDQADSALYVAKENGRNRSEAYKNTDIG